MFLEQRDKKRNIVTIGIIMAIVALNLEMEDPVNLSTEWPPDVNLMEIVTGNFACLSIRAKICLFY